VQKKNLNPPQQKPFLSSKYGKTAFASGSSSEELTALPSTLNLRELLRSRKEETDRKGGTGEVDGRGEEGK